MSERSVGREVDAWAEFHFGDEPPLSETGWLRVSEVVDEVTQQIRFELVLKLIDTPQEKV